MAERTDEELAVLVRKKDDRQAFAELIERHQRGVFALLHRTLGPDQEIEDIAQNVFIAVYRGLENFQGKAKFSTWLYRITYNQACTALRRRGAMKEKMMVQHPRDEEGKPMEFEAAGRDGPEQQVLTGQVWKLVEKLPTQARAVVELFYGQEFQYPEIAEALDLPLGTVKTHLHRARKMLREMLADEPAPVTEG